MPFRTLGALFTRILPTGQDDGGIGWQVKHTTPTKDSEASTLRHPDHYADIPFAQLDRDLMIGLFGELLYE